MTYISPTANKNPGIVPPWLRTAPVTTQNNGGNTGIVPPWLQKDEYRILPIEEEYQILPIDQDYTILPIGETQFVSEPVSISPTTLADALRNR
ncbi:MAG: hypothetical protein JWM25_807 [Thermoleophilia bacterium]|nr:hypothetical protein [Thermoleophilia bacterium]MCZ4496224.1 hypothetical protein [Thermoleophilia bacterium]